MDYYQRTRDARLDYQKKYYHNCMDYQARLVYMRDYNRAYRAKLKLAKQLNNESDIQRSILLA
jgi:hypothetical protein